MYRYSLHQECIEGILREECTGILFIEVDTDDLMSRGIDFTLLYLIPIAIQIFFYVKVSRKLWSSQVSQAYLFLQ